MKKFTAFLFLLIIITSRQAEAQAIPVIDFKSLSPHIKPSADTLKIVNFWATWCHPCVEELKYFKEAGDIYNNQKIKFVFVSLDFKSQKEKVEQFWEKHKIKGDVYILDDNPNKWMNLVDSSWSGEIPYTLILSPKNKPIKVNGELKNYKELQSLITNNLTK